VNTMIESGNDYVYVNCARGRGDTTRLCFPDRRDKLEKENFLDYKHGAPMSLYANPVNFASLHVFQLSVFAPFVVIASVGITMKNG